MKIIVYGIPNCDTVKRARTWLSEQGLDFEFHDFKKAGVPAAQADQWLAQLGWNQVINRAGTTWRKLDEASKAAVIDADSAAALMQQHPSVIKRPIVQWADGRLSLGFSPALFEQHR